MKAGIIILLILWGVGLLISANIHGQPKKGNHNFWVTLLALAFEFGLLWWAGALF